MREAWLGREYDGRSRMHPSLVIALTSGAALLVAVSLGQRVLGVLLALGGLAVLALRRRREAEMSGRERDNGIVRAILESSPSICYAVDPSGHVIFANRAFDRALALREDGALGRPLAECLSLAPGDTFALANDLACSAAAAIEVVETLHVEGERRTYVSTKLVLRDETSRPYAVCSISSDTTPRVRAEEALFQSQKLEGIGRLAGSVAHDFNNILAVIIGQSELLAKKVAPEGPAARRVAEIHRAASQGANLTRQLLAFSRKEALEPKVLGLNAVVRDVEEMLRRLIGEHIQLVVRLAPKDVAVCVDPAQMQQVLMNLAVNARDAMPRGGILTIETGVVEVDEAFLSRQPDLRPGRHGVLRVSDTGCGIPGVLVPRIFEPFFTTKAKGEGTGLGLATVHGIAKQSGGHVSVESEPGRGTTFSVYLPPAEGRAPAVGAPACAVAPSLRGAETVLYVEDDPALRALGADILRDVGYEVLVAADGSEALEVALKSPRPIDVLVSDVVLPTLNGPEVWVRLQGRYPGLPVVYVSGYTGDARLSSIVGENVRLLEKPFTSAALLAEVRAALEEVNTPPAGAKPPPPESRSGELVRAIVWTGATLAAALSAQAAPSHVEVTRPWQLAGTWSQAQGLPQDRVYAITQTRDGYLWLGTRGGVARFDGVRFTTLDDRASEPIRDNEVWALAEDAKGLWIGTYGGGLSRLEGDHVSTFTKRNGLVDEFVRVLAYHAASRTLWVGTDHGLSRLRDGRFESFGVADGLAHDVVKAVHADPDGSVWVATQPVGRWGLHRIKEGRIERIVLPGLDAAPAIEALYRSADGAMWLATLDGLLRWSNGTLTRYTGSDGLSSNRVRALHEDQRGLWVATDGGVDLLPPGATAFRSVVRDSFITDLTSTLLTDHEGNLWVGTRGRGVARFHQSLFRSYTVADGLPNAEVTAVLEDRHGTLWIGTAGGLGTFDGKGVHTLPVTAGKRPEPILALAEDGEGRLWMGTDTGVYRTVRPLASTGSPPRFERLPGIPSTRIRAIHADRRGAVWIGADTEGLFRYDGTGVIGFGAKDGLSHGAVRGLAETRDGSLWIATKGGGLDRLKDGRFTTYTTKDGLPSDSVQTLYVDAADALWVATRQGLSRLKGGRFANVGTRDGLFASHVYGLGEDLYGNLWLTCGRGIFRVVKERLDAFADGRASSIDSIAYGRDEGLAVTMASVGTHPGVTRSKDGRMFFALSGAVATVDPSDLSINTVVPPVEIEEVNIDGSAFNVRTPVAAPPGRGDMMFRYAALTFIAPEKVHFRYRLEGFDRDWVDAGTRRVAYYTNVPPGRYQFHVVASNNDGVRNETGAALGVSVATRFYRTLWFYLSCALTLVAATAAAHRWRLRQLRAHERELSARVEDAVAQIKTLKGLLPICAACKSIRDDEGYWNKMEAYIGAHSEAEFSHGICPDCARKLYPEHAHLAAGRRRPA